MHEDNQLNFINSFSADISVYTGQVRLLVFPDVFFIFVFLDLLFGYIL